MQRSHIENTIIQTAALGSSALAIYTMKAMVSAAIAKSNQIDQLFMLLISANKKPHKPKGFMGLVVSLRAEII